MADSQPYEYVDEQAINSNYICAICHTPLQNPRVTPCKHVFCHKCIQNWLSRDKSCPTCRQQLFPTELRKVMISFLNLLNEIPVRCTQCGRSRILRGDFNDHIEKQCSKRIVGCKAADIDCPWRGASDEVNDHSVQCPFEQVRSTIECLKRKNTSLTNELQQMTYERDNLRTTERRLRDELLRATEAHRRALAAQERIQSPVHVRYPQPNIRDDTRNSSCCCVCCTDTCEKIRNNCDAVKLGGIGVLIFLMIIPLAALIVGQVYKKECPIEPWVSLWMTVFGAVGVGSFGLMIIVSIITIIWFERHEDKMLTFGAAVSIVLVCFFFAWMLVGSAYVFPLQTKVQIDVKEYGNYCHGGLYKFTLACLGIHHVVFDSIIVFGGCIGVVSLCGSLHNR